jgi:hypothetical protein
MWSLKRAQGLTFANTDVQLENISSRHTANRLGHLAHFMIRFIVFRLRVD